MTIAEDLTDAQEQYHALLTGQKVRVVVDQNGERVEFTSANIGRLASYIDRLKAQIAGRSSLGPARVYF